MKNIKIIYFDSVALDSATLESQLSHLCLSLYVIKDGLLLVNFNGSSKDLFSQLFPNENVNNVLIADLDATIGSYWGFMNKSLWTWLNDNRG